MLKLQRSTVYNSFLIKVGRRTATGYWWRWESLEQCNA